MTPECKGAEDPQYSQQGVLGRTHNTGDPVCIHVVVGEFLRVCLGARLGEQEAEPVAHFLGRLGLRNQLGN